MKVVNLYLAIWALIIDVVAILAGIWLAYWLKTAGGTLFGWPFHQYISLAIFTLPIWIILFASQGLYNSRLLPRGWNGLGRLLIGLIASWGIILIALYFWRSPQSVSLSRLLVVYAIALTTVLTVMGRLILNSISGWLLYMGSAAAKTVVVSNQQDGRFIKELRNRWEHGRKIIEVISSQGAVAKLQVLAQTQKIEEIIVAEPHIADAELLDLLNWAELNNISLAAIPSFLSIRATNVETITLAGTPLMLFLPTPLNGWGRIFKRIFDIILVVIAMIILSPIFLLIALLQKVTSAGPVTFSQERVGQDGTTLKIHKFRSMYIDWPKRFPNFRDWSSDEKTDPRITPLGEFLRKTNLDELPQLWDVLVGRMSIVGPRPEQPKYVSQFAKSIPDYLKRHRVKTGLTGWAQVNGLRGDTSIEERVKYDLYYIENWSVWFDIRIVLATFKMILTGSTEPLAK